jgi:hypothetical protein
MTGVLFSGAAGVPAFWRNQWRAMDAATLTVIITLANGQTSTMTRDFATMKGCEALAAVFRDTGSAGREVKVSCEIVSKDQAQQ